MGLAGIEWSRALLPRARFSLTHIRRVRQFSEYAHPRVLLRYAHHAHHLSRAAPVVEVVVVVLVVVVVVVVVLVQG